MRHLTASSSPHRRAAAIVVAAALGLLVLAVSAAPGADQAREDFALGQAATASSVEQQARGGCPNGICTPDKANDGRQNTRWSSAFSDDQYWQVDLGRPRRVDTVAIDWQYAFAASYVIATSLDGVTFEPAERVSIPLELVGYEHVPVETRFGPRTARYVRITGERRATPYGYSIWSASVYGSDDSAPAPPAPAPTPAPAPSPAPPGQPAPPTTTQPSQTLRPISASTIVRLQGRLTRRGAAISTLYVRASRRATVRVRCQGGGCPKRTLRARGTHRFPQLHRSLRAGAVLEVFVTQRGTYGKYTRFVIRHKRAPKRVDRCLVAGRPTRCPG
jgi:F5/8 type C domain